MDLSIPSNLTTSAWISCTSTFLIISYYHGILSCILPCFWDSIRILCVPIF